MYKISSAAALCWSELSGFSADSFTRYKMWGYRYTFEEKEKRESKTHSLRGNAMIPALTVRSRYTTHNNTLTEWLMSVFFLLSGAEKPNNKAKLTWCKSSAARLSCTTMGGFKKPQPMFAESQQIKEPTGFRKWAVTTFLTTILVFEREKAALISPLLAHLFTCWSSTFPAGFNFITWMHTARWYAATVPVQLLQIVPSGKPFLSRPI